GVSFQAPAGKDEPPTGALTDANDVLDPVQVGGEESDEDAAAGLGNEPLQGLGDDALRWGLALDLGVGRVTEQADRLAIGQRFQPPEIGGPGVERRVVELEVAGVDERALRRAEQEADRIGDGVGDPERLDLEDGRRTEWLPGKDLPEVRADVHLVESP